MGLANYTYCLRAESGDSTPHDELAVSGDLSGGTISLVDAGGGDYFWRFVGQAVVSAPSKAVSTTTNGGGATIAFRAAVTAYGSTDFAALIGYSPSGSPTGGLYMSRTTANIQRYRWAANSTATQTVNTSIRTIVIKVACSTTSNQDNVYAWLDNVSRSGSTPDVSLVAGGSNLTGATINEIFVSNTGATVEVSDLVIWGEELSDADCAALADDGIRTTLDSLTSFKAAWARGSNQIIGAGR